MILDGLPLELMREVLLDLPTVDIIQTVKCTRRLYHFAKVDKALSRRLQNRVFNVRLCFEDYELCAICRKPVLIRFLSMKFHRANNAVNHSNNSRFSFWFENECKCGYIADPTLEIESGILDHPSFLYDNHLLRGFENGTSFVIKNDSLDEAIINCSKLFNILMKFCVVRKLKLSINSNNDDNCLWDKMNAFFNANPPDLRIQFHVSTDSRINLDIFLTGRIFSNGFAGIEVYNGSEPTLTNAYHEVLRRTPNVLFLGMNLPYTYEDLFGFFKDTKTLSLWSAARITEKQICQLVQHFYEVKQDEERMFEIGIDESLLVKDFLALIPEEAYKLHLKRSGIVGPEPETRTWVEMTDRFGGRWALIVAITDYHWSFLNIGSMKYFIEGHLTKPCNEFSLNQFFN